MIWDKCTLSFHRTLIIQNCRRSPRYRKLSFPLVPNSRTRVTKETCSCKPLTSPSTLCTKTEDQGDCNEVGCFPLKRRKKKFFPDNNLISDRRWGFYWFNSCIFKDSFCIVLPFKTLAKPLVSHQWKIMRRARICSSFLLWEKDYYSFCS